MDVASLAHATPLPPEDERWALEEVPVGSSSSEARQAPSAPSAQLTTRFREHTDATPAKGNQSSHTLTGILSPISAY